MNFKNRIIRTGTADPKTLKANTLNWRKHPDAQRKAMRDVLGNVGWIQDVIINETTGNIIDGHLRVETAIKNKETEIPVKYVELSEDEEKTALATFDPITAMAERDDELLKQLLAGVDTDMDLSQFHDDYDKLMRKEHTAEELDAVPAVLKNEVKTKRGDVYRLGDHILMCGDATSEEDVSTLMKGEVANLALTDPPYGISAVHVERERERERERESTEQLVAVGLLGSERRSGGDNMEAGRVAADGIAKARYYMPIIGDESTDTAKRSYEVLKVHSKEQILFGGNYFTDFLKPSRCWIVWDKENTGNFADVELAWASFKKGAKIYRWLWNGLSRKGNRQEELTKRVHPTQKPVGMFKAILEDFSKDGDIILDVFGGSGSTLIACEETGRKCRMMELAPEYCDVIVERWEKLTGKKAERLT